MAGNGQKEELSMPSRWSATAGTRAEPRVLHGYTLTKEVPFREVAQAIKETAFVASDLPIIVSLEIHACLEQQEIMVEIIEDVWRDHLVRLSFEEAKQSCDSRILPGPDQLRRKILIKVKSAPSVTKGPRKSGEPEESTESEDERAPAAKGKKQKKTKVLPALSDLGIYTRAFSFKSLDQAGQYPSSCCRPTFLLINENVARRSHNSHTCLLSF